MFLGVDGEILEKERLRDKGGTEKGETEEGDWIGENKKGKTVKDRHITRDNIAIQLKGKS